MRRIFVTGVSTEVGKTIASAILTEALQADYWKPVQTGSLEMSDTETVRKLVSNGRSRIHSPSYVFSAPLSPHAAARLENSSISLAGCKVPRTKNTMIIEGAGGLLVPLNDQGDLITDLIKKLKAEVVLVSKNYLGSINHTLLSIKYLEMMEIPTTGIIFNGSPNPESENFILQSTGIRLLGRIPSIPFLNKETVCDEARNFIFI